MTDDDSLDALTKEPASQIAWGVQSSIESRWPASVAILVAIGLYLALPSRYTVGPAWLMPGLELSILLPISLSSPRRVAQEGRLQQVLAIAMIAIVNVANLVSLILLI